MNYKMTNINTTHNFTIGQLMSLYHYLSSFRTMSFYDLTKLISTGEEESYVIKDVYSEMWPSDLSDEIIQLSRTIDTQFYIRGIK